MQNPTEETVSNLLQGLGTGDLLAAPKWYGGVYHKKDWGYELWIENNLSYCLKIIWIECGQTSSKGRFHYHFEKDETFLILQGRLRLEIELDGVIRGFEMRPGDHYRVRPTSRHRFKPVGGDCLFIEGSSGHSENDTRRCEWINGSWAEE